MDGRPRRVLEVVVVVAVSSSSRTIESRMSNERIVVHHHIVARTRWATGRRVVLVDEDIARASSSRASASTTGVDRVETVTFERRLDEAAGGGGRGRGRGRGQSSSRCGPRAIAVDPTARWVSGLVPARASTCDERTSTDW